MQTAMIHFSPVKDGRRILGDKDSNACLSPAHHTKHTLSITGTPTKQTLFTAPSPKVLLPSPIFAGQKRTRDQVDCIEVSDGHLQELRGVEHGSSQSTIQHTDEQLHPTPDAKESRVSTSASQPQHDESRQHMEINQSPTATRDSRENTTHAVPQDPNARRLFIQQKATILRNTLQTAMRNVTDHQIDRRVSELEAHSRKVPRLSFSALSSSPCMSYRKATTPQFCTPRIGSMPEMSSTPCQQTPDLPRPSSMVKHADRVKTTQRTPPRTLGSPMQLSSPPATVIRHSRSRDVNESETSETGIAARSRLSPLERGDAVDGLLKLMSTADRHESSDSWTG